MLKKQFRLRKQKDFENVFDRGVYFHGSFLTLKAVENSLSLSRFGFIVSNKISKKATERNRTKRLLRESIRLKQEEIITGFDLVFIARNGIIGKKLSEVNSAVEKLLKKSGLLANKSRK